jgi:predicted MFS family arabinose efflux permease
MPSARRLFGDEIERDLRPLLWSVALASVGQFAFFSFFAIWALEVLDAPQAQVGLAFTASAVAAVAGGIAGGRVSDRVGRRPVVTAAAGAQALLPAVLVLPVGRLPAFAVLVGMGFLQPFRGTTQRALLADLTPEDRRVQAFGAFRVVNNAGAAAGPLMAAALVTVAWPLVHLAIAVVYALSIVPALRLPDPASARTDGPPARLATLLRRRGFVLLFGAGLLGWATYNAFEVLLPVVLTQSHGLSPAMWGPLYVVNAFVVVFLQLRVTRWTARLGTGRALVAAMLLMGLPFLALEAGASIALVLAVVLLFVLGEMLWAPNGEALASRLAPPGMRGVYLGAVGAAAWAGAALTPATGLGIRAAYGDGAMWLAVAVAALAAAALYAAAAREVERMPAPAARPVPQTP